MKKLLHSKSAFVHWRFAAAVALCLFGASLGWLSYAATPPTGNISVDSPSTTYETGPFVGANATPILLVDAGPRCGPANPCDSYVLTVTLPAGYVAANPNAAVKVITSWIDTGSDNSDYDVYIYNGEVGDLSGNQSAPYQSASGENPEIALITPLNDGVSKYTIKIVPYTPTAETVHVKMQLESGNGEVGFPGFGGRDPSAPGKPRYQNFYAPSGSSAEPGSGEFNIGFNPATKRIMAMNSGPIWRLTPPEVAAPGTPECCEALWEDKSAPNTNTGLDPILWTDQPTGRTFASNFTGGANALYAFSDNDGDLWVPFGGALPNLSADHQTIATGPYPASLSALINPLTNKGQATYYCAQDIVGPAACQRSDDLGMTYGASTLAYDGTQCAGLHGHIRVGPDGTAYLPVPNCDGKAGVAVSTDGGLTWHEFYLPNSLPEPSGSDPAIAITPDNKIYYSYILNVNDGDEGQIHVQVGTLTKDVTGQPTGITWSKDTDLGASHGVKHSAFPQAVAGDNGRVAIGFLGTDRKGSFQSLAFPGIWYAFVATTFDGGDTWTTVNVSPNDPVQGLGGIWQQGGSHDNRNLLDFNEMTIDDKGRPLFGYSDGCVGDCLGDPVFNSFTAYMRVARQSGGRTLFASQDGLTDTTTALVPKAPCLRGNRDQYASHLTWQEPDNGGAEIVNYEVYRSTSPGTEVLIGQTGSNKTAYTDTTADPSVPHYYYKTKAINAAGSGPLSNEIDLVVVPLPPPESICLPPGLTKLTDPAGDSTGPLGADLLSFQIAQPASADGIQRIIFTINTDPGVSPQPPGSSWYVAMKIADAAQPGTFYYRAVHMTWKTDSPSTPVFESYVPGASTGGVVDGRFVDEPIKPAEPESHYNAPYNQIVIVAKASELDLKPGDRILGFIAGVTQTSNPAGLPGPTATQVHDGMPGSLSFANSYILPKTGGCSLPGAVSRKVHGDAGEFDLALPASGSVAIEPRSGGANNAYTIVYAFDAPVLVAGTPNVTQGSANLGTPTVGPNPNQVTVPLTNVTSPQHLVVNLTGAQDVESGVLPSLTARMDVLTADTTADGAVNSGDISQVKSQSGQFVTSSNYRTDVTVDGALNSGDVALVKSRSGTALPSAPVAPAESTSTTETARDRQPRIQPRSPRERQGRRANE